MKKKLTLVFTVCAYSINAQHIFYPIGIYDQSHVYAVEQLSRAKLKAWLVNIETGEQHSVLSTMFCPYGIAPMPEQQGFCFVDNDLIRIKYIHNKSPKTIEIEEPLHNISWLSCHQKNNLLFMAKKYEQFSIYQTDMDGNTTAYAHHHIADCMYPEYMKDTLFYLRRYNKHYTAFVSQAHDEIAQEQCSLEGHAYAFLRMYSKKLGFVVQHPSHISSDDRLIGCRLVMLEKRCGVWFHQPLFEFFVPAQYIIADSDYCLTESIIPFLPVYVGKYRVMYTQATIKNDTIFNTLMAYDITQDQSYPVQKTLEFPQTYLGCVSLNNTVYCGSITVEDLEGKFIVANC